jgi:hypothetical protein
MNQVLKQLKRLHQMQCKNNTFFSDGLFAAKRIWAEGLYTRHDNTAFFAACIGFTLLRYKNLFTVEEQEEVDIILKKMIPAFEKFRNKDGHTSYNFWQTEPSNHFPNGYFAKRFKFFMIPDDIDDSSMIHLVKPHSKQEQLALKDKMVRYAIGNLKWPDKPVKGYEKFKPYNTFFVKNMPAAFDICALCNALYFVYYYQLPLNEQDEHSIKLIIKCIEQDDHMKRPYAMSPYYPKSTIIIYHIVRLMLDLKVAALLPFKDQLITSSKELLIKTKAGGIESLLLHICIQRLGKNEIILEEPLKQEKTHFPFFVAGILGEVRPKWLRALANSDVTHIKYCCAAYAEVIWLEHLLLNRKATQSILNN